MYVMKYTMYMEMKLTGSGSLGFGADFLGLEPDFLGLEPDFLGLESDLGTASLGLVSSGPEEVGDLNDDTPPVSSS